MRRITVFTNAIFVLFTTSSCITFDDASEFTKKANSEGYSRLDFSDESEKENATRGLIEGNNSFEIRDNNGTVIWSAAKYQYIHGVKEIPDTVNPSL